MKIGQWMCIGKNVGRLLTLVLLSSCSAINESKVTAEESNPDSYAVSGAKQTGSSIPNLYNIDKNTALKLIHNTDNVPTKKIIENPQAAFYADIERCGVDITTQQPQTFALKDLMLEEIRLSNHDLSSMALTLNLMGYKVLDASLDAQPASKFNCDELPVIVLPSQDQDLKVSFGDEDGEGYNIADAGGTNISQLGASNVAELDRLLVYYHPSKAQTFNKLKWLISEKLDVPAPQVYIETMVLEIREEDSKEFGIQYDKVNGDKSISIGSLIPGLDTFNYLKNSIIDPLNGTNVYAPGREERLYLKAMIEEGKAEVLSRPSVLAVSNRQAFIQIVDVIQSPELRSTLSQTGGLQVSSYQFSPLLIGITLNLKPRVSADRKWLTLELDITVESEDDENTGEVYAPSEDGERVLLAEKQGSSSKKVRTFARIPDRTPIIIGGLVSKSTEQREGKVPFLGDIPVLGKLFTSVDDEIQRRELIIVLTPYILAEDSHSINTNRPNKNVTEKNKESVLFN